MTYQYEKNSASPISAYSAEVHLGTTTRITNNKVLSGKASLRLDYDSVLKRYLVRMVFKSDETFWFLDAQGNRTEPSKRTALEFVAFS